MGKTKTLQTVTLRVVILSDFSARRLSQNFGAKLKQKSAQVRAVFFLGNLLAQNSHLQCYRLRCFSCSQFMDTTLFLKLGKSFRNALSTAGTSMTSSGRPSPEPLLKKGGAPSRTEFWKCSGCLECLECLELQGLGDLSRTLEGNSRKRSESVSSPESRQPHWGYGPVVISEKAKRGA